MENEQLYDKIGVFLSNAMQESDKANFEKEIDQNPELKAEVAQLALLKNIAQKQQTRTLIQEIHSQKMQEWGLAEEKEADLTIGQTKNNVRALGVGRTIYLWKRMSMAIAACLVFAVGYLSLSPISTPQPDMEMVTERGKDTNLSQSDKFYYEQFSLGQDFLKKDKNVEAIACFEKVQTAEGIRQYYKDASTWFMAVAYLNNYQPEKAKILMQEIEANPDFTYEIGALERLKMEVKLIEN